MPRIRLYVDMEREEKIKILGARVHNLKNVDLEIPRRKLVVVTGLSGSGKSSLAFDTIYAEGQRRYMETLSAYARQFVGTMERPDVDKITGLSPVVAIEQKTTNKNPRSTVGTVTEINDFLRLLYARASRAYSPETGEEMVHYGDDRIAELILEGFAGRKIALLAPVVKGRKGHYRELFESLAKKGYLYARIDGEIREIAAGMKLDRYKIHTIDLVIDRLVAGPDAAERILTSLREAMRQGKGSMAVYDYGTEGVRYYSRHLMCPSTGVSFEDPAPHTFSFNSPKGACPRCNGLGEEAVFDADKIIPDRSKSLRGGAVEPLGKCGGMLFAILEALGRRHGFTMDDPVEAISAEGMNAILYGDAEPLAVDISQFAPAGGTRLAPWEGVAEYIARTEDDDSARGRKWREQFLAYRRCSACDGTRLKPEALQFRIAGRNIAEVSSLSLDEFARWIGGLRGQMNDKEWTIAREVVKEIGERTQFLLEVGLGYLSLARASRTLSGGESQRIRLATQIGSKLVNVLYILDEPSIGLHQRDNRRLIRSLEQLRDAGNSVIVVEHDEEMMRAADYIVDVGPGAGRRGGRIVAAGTFDEILRAQSVTADYLTGRRRIEVPEHRRKGSGQRIAIRGARGNNLRSINAEFPLGVFVCVTGVSGSGKSTLVRDILYRALLRHLGEPSDAPGQHKSIGGDLHRLHAVEFVDQNPIGRSTRSNPATYLKAYDEIRRLFADQQGAKQMGFGPGYFSFNTEGGRCEECKGEGTITIEMQFMADITIPCEECHGQRFKRDVLDITYRGRNINDVLNMTVDDAIAFFSESSGATEKKIVRRLLPLQQVGLGYITLGQSSSTLSGGENQRVKLAYYLSMEKPQPTMFIFDEPTTGLHFHDIHTLMDSFNRLIALGHTVVIIEHNLDVVKCADHVIDIGPEGGDAGGSLVAAGTPEQVADCNESYTGRFLKEKLPKK